MFLFYHSIAVASISFFQAKSGKHPWLFQGKHKKGKRQIKTKIPASLQERTREQPASAWWIQSLQAGSIQGGRGLSLRISNTHCQPGVLHLPSEAPSGPASSGREHSRAGLVLIHNSPRHTGLFRGSVINFSIGTFQTVGQNGDSPTMSTFLPPPGYLLSFAIHSSQGQVFLVDPSNLFSST